MRAPWGTASFGRGPGHPKKGGNVSSVEPGSDDETGRIHPSLRVGVLGPISFDAWVRSLLKSLLASRTAFGAYVAMVLSSCRDRSSMPVSSALFPIPMPLDEAWIDGPKKLGVARRQRRAIKRLVHLIIMALNYAFASSPFSNMKMIWRQPCTLHRAVYARLELVCRAGGPPGSVDVLGCGRKSHQLSARFQELLSSLQSLGLERSTAYHKEASGGEVHLVNDVDELRPYRSLDADRLKLTGTGSWDPCPYLSDLFYMPYVEPRVNQFDIQPPSDVVPDFSNSSAIDTLKLCKLWDRNSLLKIFPQEYAPDEIYKYTKVFNNFKGPLVDRQIGDRRGANYIEGKLEGESRFLPTGVSLLQIMPKKRCHFLVGSLTDRRDFYHQFWTSSERSSTNLVFPPLSLKDLEGTDAYDVFLNEFAIKKRIVRERDGDDLHGRRRPILFDPDQQVVGAFTALFQGDHLGVEFATQSHGRFLCDHGLLPTASRLQSGSAVEDDECVQGLIIDDFFALSLEESIEDLSCSGSVIALDAAKRAYSSAGLLGSDDKDIRGSLLFRVCGMQVDSRPTVVEKGMVAAAAPAEKRFGLAHLTAQCAGLPYTDDALHSCLVGSWVSLSLMRRPVLSVLNEVFKVIPPEKLDPEKPVLWPLSRKAADELALVSVLSAVAVSNLAVDMDTTVYATDASLARGGIVATEVEEDFAKQLWRTADQKARGVPMMKPAEAMLSIYDVSYEPEICPGGTGEDEVAGVPRPRGLEYDFIEVCGGAGVVSKYLSKFGAVVGPVLDLSFSKQYDLSNHRVLLWLIHMLESGRLRSTHTSPPCTSFSPAAYPCVRSYRCPEGFDQENPKVKIGNILAYYSLVLLFVGLRTRSFVMGETPRRSKMRWLKVWKALIALGASEVFLASCMFGSPHQKEFCFLTVNMQCQELSRRCSRDHSHVRIQGSFTKASAVYCDGLAEAMAWCFWKHLVSGRRAERHFGLRAQGLEDVVTNDLCLAAEWKSISSWKWKGFSHINVLETAASNALVKIIAKKGGDLRFVNLLDSHVAKSAVTRLRTSSGALVGLLKQRAMMCLAYGLYPAHRFAPTRLNPADHPTRCTRIPDPVRNSILQSDPKLRFRLFKLGSLRRWIANWARLALLLDPHLSFFAYHSESCRRHGLLAISSHELLMDFDATLGYPGEGRPSWIFPFWILVLMLKGFCGCTPVAAVSHGDLVRQKSRAGIELKEGRRVLETTSAIRSKLLESFCEWLGSSGKSFDEIFLARLPDLDLLNSELCRYGRWLFSEGKPYYHFSELLNAVTSRRPILRRSLQQSWDLAFMWGSFEPVEHHVAMPHQILVALIASAWCWGWSREAAIFALSFGALLRIGEVLQAKRSDVLMPEDVGHTVSYVLIRIKEPKTRFRAARHQASKVEQPDLVQIIRVGFSSLRFDEPLWHMSGSTLRTRLEKLLTALNLPCKAHQVPKPLTLASFRPGGATWLIAECENVDLVKRRGRWASYKVMECYLQEVMSSTYMLEISVLAKQKVLDAVNIFPALMLQVIHFKTSHIPEATWWYMLAKVSEQAKKVQVG